MHSEGKPRFRFLNALFWWGGQLRFRSDSKPGPDIFHRSDSGQSEPKITEKQDNLSQIWRLVMTTWLTKDSTISFFNPIGAPHRWEWYLYISFIFLISVLHFCDQWQWDRHRNALHFFVFISFAHFNECIPFFDCSNLDSQIISFRFELSSFTYDADALNQSIFIFNHWCSKKILISSLSSQTLRSFTWYWFVPSIFFTDKHIKSAWVNFYIICIIWLGYGLFCLTNLRRDMNSFAW
jgi:hypothetical protein